jgi:hypothetical protein
MRKERWLATVKSLLHQRAGVRESALGDLGLEPGRRHGCVGHHAAPVGVQEGDTVVACGDAGSQGEVEAHILTELVEDGSDVVVDGGVIGVAWGGEAGERMGMGGEDTRVQGDGLAELMEGPDFLEFEGTALSGEEADEEVAGRSHGWGVGARLTGRGVVARVEGGAVLVLERAGLSVHDGAGGAVGGVDKGAAGEDRVGGVAGCNLGTDALVKGYLVRGWGIIMGVVIQGIVGPFIEGEDRRREVGTREPGEDGVVQGGREDAGAPMEEERLQDLHEGLAGDG